MQNNKIERNNVDMKSERKKRKMNEMKMSEWRWYRILSHVKRGKKVLNLKICLTLGEVKNVTCVPFYQLIFFFITGLSRFVVWLSSKSVFYTHKMQIWLKWLRIWLGLQKFRSVTTFFDHKYPCFCQEAVLIARVFSWSQQQLTFLYCKR
jgi:hypothetical protein